MLKLEVQSRGMEESPDALRSRGLVPAIFYGPKEETTSIAVDSLKLERVWREAGETTVVTLEGAGEEKDTLIHDVQSHPVTGKLLHADFYVLEKGKKISLSIPLVFAGVAPAEKVGHIIVKTLHEVEIEVEPKNIPHNLSVDLSKLENVGDHITAADIPLPESAELVTSPAEIVVSVKEFHEESAEITPPPQTIIEGEEKATEKEAKATEEGTVGGKKEAE